VGAADLNPKGSDVVGRMVVEALRTAVPAFASSFKVQAP
jgi:hypothetical protein